MGKKLLKLLAKYTLIFIILDVMMPEMDGIEACRLMRSMPEFKQVFMVFLTARSEEYSEIAGFHVGADDYIAKPIKPRALMSRINAILRRNTTEALDDQSTDKLEIADLIIDRDSFLVYRGEEKFVLAKRVRTALPPGLQTQQSIYPRANPQSHLGRLGSCYKPDHRRTYPEAP